MNSNERNCWPACPCLVIEPCDPDCTCVRPFMSRGCKRCASYGSVEQRKSQAQFVADAIDGAIEARAEVARLKVAHEQERAYWREACDGDAYLDGLTIERLTAERDQARRDAVFAWDGNCAPDLQARIEQYEAEGEVSGG